MVCEEEPYLLELVRYIHLNPLRSGLVKDLEELQGYPWCGHGVLMGRDKVSWQKFREVLGYFSERLRKARLGYRRFMLDGIDQGRRPELTRGGFMQRMKGNEDFKDKQRFPKKELSDPRILGSRDFVESVLRRNQRETKAPRLTWKELVDWVAKWAGITPLALCSGSKRPSIAEARSILSYIAVRQMRMRTTEVAELLNVSQSTISKLVLRGEEIIPENEEIMAQI